MKIIDSLELFYAYDANESMQMIKKNKNTIELYATHHFHKEEDDNFYSWKIVKILIKINNS